MEGIRKCLSALEKQVAGHEPCEVLVVDNGSAEDVCAALTGLSDVRVIREPTRGSYAARNRGIAEGRGEVLAFTDADCIPDPDWLARGIAYLDAYPEVSLLAGRVSVTVADPEHPTAAEIYEMLNAFPQETYVIRHRFGATANLFVRKVVFDTVGPFLESVLSGGDWEFGRRATAAGFSLAFTPDVVVEHPARSSLRSLGNKTKRTLAGKRDLSQAEDKAPSDSVAAILRNLVPPLPSTYRAFSDRRLCRLPDRAKYALAVLVLHYMRTWARLHLALGAQSPR